MEKKACLIILACAGLIASCSKSDSKSGDGVTTIPSQLTGEFREKALSEKSALPSQQQVDALLGSVRKTNGELPNYSLYQKEAELDQKTGDAKTKAEAEIKELKSKLTAKELELHQNMMENCRTESSTPRGPKEGEKLEVGKEIGITALMSTSSLPGKSCPLIVNVRLDMDAKVTESNAETKVQGGAGSGSVSFRYALASSALQKSSGLKEMNGRLSGNFAVLGNTGEFGGGNRSIYGKVNFNANIEMIDASLQLDGGMEVLQKNDDSQIEMALTLRSPGLVLAFGLLKNGTQETFLLNGNNYSKEQFAQVMKELFNNVNPTQSQKTSSLMVNQLQDSLDVVTATLLQTARSEK